MESSSNTRRLGMRRAVVVQQSDGNASSSGSVARGMMSMSTLRRKKKGKHSSTTTDSSNSPPRNAPTPPVPFGAARDSPLFTPSPRPTIASAPRDELLSNAQPSSQSNSEIRPKGAMPPAALYSIIAAGGVFLILAFVFACIFFRRRKRQERQTADWYGVQEKRLSDSAFGGPGKGPGLRKMQLDDDDSYSEDEKQFESDVNAPTHILSKFPKLGKQSSNTANQEKPMEISKPFGMNFHVTNPDFVPTRPPRPSAHIDLGTSPNRTTLKSDPEEDDMYDEEDDMDEDAYERNILALTTSMAFDTPRDRQSRAFDPSLPPPDSVDLGSSMKEGRDTIVGFAESYGALSTPVVAQEDVIPVRPLHIRNPSTATTRSKRPHFERHLDSELPSIDRGKVSATPPTLSSVDLGLAASESTTSMRELEDVLGSFGRTGTPLEKDDPMEAAYQSKQVSSNGATFIMESGKPPYAASKIPAYKLNKPAGIERGLSVTRNTLSIQSTAGEVFETSPTYITFPSSATSPQLSNMSYGDSNETLVEAASAVSSKRVSFAIDKERSLADTGRVQSLAELVRSKSLRHFNSNSDLKQGNLRGAFEEMDNTTLTDSTETYSSTAGLQSFGSRVRSSSFHGLSPALHSGWRVDRQRTSTAYGGQMPPTPLLAMPLARDKRKTTDSEARFALGSHMLSVLDSPGTGDQISPSLPYLRSPDLRIQPPSPSQASENTTFSALDRESYQDRLSHQGFTPLGDMALSSGNSGHSQCVFEFDDPHHSAVINSISVQ